MSYKIPDIRFYNFNFELLHIENNFTSSNWQIHYNDIGTFEAHFDLESDTIPIIMDNDYIVAVQGENSAIIIGKKLGNDFSVFGRTCNWLLTKRIINEFSSNDENLYDLVTNKVMETFSDSPFTIGNPIYDTPLITIERSEKCAIYNFVQECLSQYKFGHRVKYDFTNSKFIFEVIRGNETNPLVIATTNRNAYDVEMNGDFLDLLTEGWYERSMENMGEWSPVTNQVIKDDEIIGSIVDNTPSNYGCYWKVSEDGSKFNINFKKGDYLVCKETTGKLQKDDDYKSFWAKIYNGQNKTGIYRFEGLLSGKNETEAIASLFKATSNNYIQGKTSNISFKSDYELGDIVTVEWQTGKYKKRIRKRIESINFWYEPGNIGEEPVFEDVLETE